MPSLPEEILLMLDEGSHYLLNPRALFRVGLPYNPRSLYKAAERLRKKGLVAKQRKETKIFLRLTDKGKKLLQQHRSTSLRSPRRWDGKWRLVFFDVPEKRGDARRYLRDYLKNLGFGKIQRSVWLSPYQFSKHIDHFARKLGLTDCLIQVTVDKFRNLDNDTLVKLCWDIEETHFKYLQLLKKYSEKLEQTQGVVKQSPDKKIIAWKTFIQSLLWDYQAILAEDPQLPPELLPADWGGKAAHAFAEKWRVLHYKEAE